MQTANPNLEARVTALEQEIQQVKTVLTTIHPRSSLPWWEQVAGTFKDDPLFDDMVEAGQHYRRALTRKSRR